MRDTLPQLRPGDGRAGPSAIAIAGRQQAAAGSPSAAGVSIRDLRDALPRRGRPLRSSTAIGLWHTAAVTPAKVLLITGGSRGIGAATARLAARAGYAVVVNYATNQAAADAVAGELRDRGGEAFPVQADVSRDADVVRMFEAIDARFGRLDALVNNAAIVDLATTVEQMSAERITRLFAINVLGSFLCAREAVRRMSTARGGRGGAIINVSSGAARWGSPNEYVDYAASKGAIDTFTIGLAKEVATQGIRVNAVRPGVTRTEIHLATGNPGRMDAAARIIPMKRIGEPDEIARAIVWLLSEEASYATGSILDVSGGL
jgi:NAD(P)-dependent dehydrogenase (short-subunit alcohol dehydrogenase family)